jgi:hypothetical protein
MVVMALSVSLAIGGAAAAQTPYQSLLKNTIGQLQADARWVIVDINGAFGLWENLETALGEKKRKKLHRIT